MAEVHEADRRTSTPRRQGKAVNRRHRGAAAAGATERRAPKSAFGLKARYWFDTALSRGPSVVIGWLGLLTLIIILLGALVITAFRIGGINGAGDLGFAEAFWQALLRVLDAGSFAGDTGWFTRILSLLITLSGIFLAGSLIGLIANAVDQRIELLRKGRSTVLEERHTLILGWSERVPAIVRELIVANESEKRAAIVVMADEDKTTMEDKLRDEIENFATTRLVCRRGECSSPADLELVNLAGARSVIVVGGNDARSVKTLLAIRAVDPAGDASHVVVELDDSTTAHTVASLFGDGVVVVNSDEVMAELTAQACRQRGLSQVFHELLDFAGDEMYFAAFPELVGHTYAHAQLAFESSCLMGLLAGDGTVLLNPPAGTVLGAENQLIAIAADDSLFRCTGLQDYPARPLATTVSEPVADRRMIVVGWSALGPRVVRELDEFLGAETTIEIVVDPAVVDPAAVRAVVAAEHVSIEITAYSGGSEQLAAFAAERAFHEIILLGQREGISSEDADARTLLNLLAFKQVVREKGFEHVRIVAELLEQRHAPLAQATGADDFIVSDELTSLMMAQLSERPELDKVFRDLFDRSGCTIELVPVDQLGGTGATRFGELVATTSGLGATAIGYRRGHDGTVVLNPTKSTRLTLASDDMVVLLR